MKDEYRIKQILIDNDTDAMRILPLLNEQLDKSIGVYIDNSEGIKKSAFTEMKCYLLKALIDSEDDEQLKQRINKIVEAI